MKPLSELSKSPSVMQRLVRRFTSSSSASSQSNEKKKEKNKRREAPEALLQGASLPLEKTMSSSSFGTATPRSPQGGGGVPSGGVGGDSGGGGSPLDGDPPRASGSPFAHAAASASSAGAAVFSMNGERGRGRSSQQQHHSMRAIAASSSTAWMGLFYSPTEHSSFEGSVALPSPPQPPPSSPPSTPRSTKNSRLHHDSPASYSYGKSAAAAEAKATTDHHDPEERITQALLTVNSELSRVSIKYLQALGRCFLVDETRGVRRRGPTHRGGGCTLAYPTQS